MEEEKRYDFRETPASTAVVETVAEREGVDIDAVTEPLDGTINGDALNVLAESMIVKNASGVIRFSYAGYIVTLWSDGRIGLRERD